MRLPHPPNRESLAFKRGSPPSMIFRSGTDNHLGWRRQMSTTSPDFRSGPDKSRLLMAWVAGVGAVIALGFLAAEMFGIS